MCARVLCQELQDCGYSGSEGSLVSRDRRAVGVGSLDEYRTAAVDGEAGKRASKVTCQQLNRFSIECCKTKAKSNHQINFCCRLDRYFIWTREKKKRVYAQIRSLPTIPFSFKKPLLKIYISGSLVLSPNYPSTALHASPKAFQLLLVNFTECTFFSLGKGFIRFAV